MLRLSYLSDNNIYFRKLLKIYIVKTNHFSNWKLLALNILNLILFQFAPTIQVRLKRIDLLYWKLMLNSFEYINLFVIFLPLEHNNFLFRFTWISVIILPCFKSEGMGSEGPVYIPFTGIAVFWNRANKLNDSMKERDKLSSWVIRI